MKTKHKTAAISRTAIIKFRCLVGEKKMIKQQATACSKTISEYCRGQALHGKVYAPRRLTPEERQYFITLKDQNLGLARIRNLIRNRDPALYRAVWEFLAEAKTLYNRFF